MSREVGYPEDLGRYRRVEHALALDPPSHDLVGAALIGSLRGFVRGRLGDHADGDDLVQETFIRLLRHQTVSQVGNAKALCFAILRNLLIDHHRATARVGYVELDDDMACPQPTAEMVVAYRRAVALMARALEAMPPLRREVFLRKRLDGCTTAAITDSLEMSTAAVEKHVVRALGDLRAALARRGFTMDGGA